jgi:putative hemolysin
MVPRTRIVALNLELPQEEILRTVQENMYTRYPVYRKDRENIVGFIHSKDLFLHPGLDDPEFALEEIVRAPLYVPETKHANELLREMQRKRVQIAFVVDEYGCINGLVTTEDLLEELVGEIEDEHDAGEARRAERLADGSLMIDALMSLNDLEELLDVKFEEGLPYDTIAGLILAKLGRFPELGEQVEWKEFNLICEEVSATSIIKIRIICKGVGCS